MRGWMVVGNWKMHCTTQEARRLAAEIRDGVGDIKRGIVAVAPPFTALLSVYEEIKNSPVKLCAQNLFYEEKGAYTGEISPLMLLDCGCSYVIVGHSERRRYFKERDEDINIKVKKAISLGITPILCVGETLEEREKDVTEFVVGLQVKKGLFGVEEIEKVTIAYEPVWAIGTGRNATPAEAQEVQRFIRNILVDMYGDVAFLVKILYGGSVTDANIGELAQMDDIDGALVGGASLKSETFTAIIKKVREVKE